jgi:uncharacterized protein (TIGR00730 family)
MSTDKTHYGQDNIVRVSDEDATAAVIEHAVTGLWDVVNELTRLRRSSRQNYRVTIFGSARIQPDTPAYDAVKKLAAELTAMGCDILTGGGPGLMQAANEGANSVAPEGKLRSIGINIELPHEQNVNSFVGQAYGHTTFFSRLHHFMLVSDAFIVVPGGIGSLLEMSLAWQLLQVQKLQNTPLVLIGKMWSGLIDWGRQWMLRDDFELASEVDFEIPICAETLDEAIEVIRMNRIAWLAAQNANQERVPDEA